MLRGGIEGQRVGYINSIRFQKFVYSTFHHNMQAFAFLFVSLTAFIAVNVSLIIYINLVLDICPSFTINNCLIKVVILLPTCTFFYLTILL